jgi:hypothetical protein
MLIFFSAQMRLVVSVMLVVLVVVHVEVLSGNDEPVSLSWDPSVQSSQRIKFNQGNV